MPHPSLGGKVGVLNWPPQLAAVSDAAIEPDPAVGEVYAKAAEDVRRMQAGLRS